MADALATAAKQLADAASIVELLTTSAEETVEAEEVAALAEMLAEVRAALSAHPDAAAAAPLLAQAAELDQQVAGLGLAAENPATAVHNVEVTLLAIEKRLGETSAQKARLESALAAGADGDGDGGGSVNGAALDAGVRVLHREIDALLQRVAGVPGHAEGRYADLDARLVAALQRVQACYLLPEKV